MSFYPSLNERLNEFRLNGNFCDVTIQVEGKLFQCHRAVLASGCDYFNCLFGNNFKEGSQVNAITLPEIDAISFNIILESFYLNRKPSCDADNVCGLLRLSDFLLLQTVKNCCVEYILAHTSSLSLVTVFKIFHLACNMNDILLKDTMTKYCVKYHLENLVQEHFFLEMTYDCLNSLLQQYRLLSENCISENFLLGAIVRWIFFSFLRCGFFRKLIDMLDFDKITKDCVEFLLGEYKTNCKMNLECDQNTSSALKTLVLDAFSLNKPVDDDNTMIISYQDPTMSIYIYAPEEPYETMWTVLHLNESDTCQVGDSRDSSNPSSVDNIAVSKPVWTVSCKFPWNDIDCDETILTSSRKSNHIFCLFDHDKFRAYNSVDLSSKNYTELASPSPGCKYRYRFRNETCRADNGNIYLCDRYTSEIHCYDCNVNKWFPVLGMKTQVRGFNCVPSDNLLYLIEGKNFNEFLNEYIQAYDCRTPRWFELSRSKTNEDNDSNLQLLYHQTSCVGDGKIYVYDGSQFRVFDLVARKWISDGLGAYTWPGQRSDILKLMFCRKQLFVFGMWSAKYFSYNFTTNTFKNSILSTNNSHSYNVSNNVIV